MDITQMRRGEILLALRVERRKVRAQRAQLLRDIAAAQREIDELDSRLRMIDESEGLL